MILDLHKTAGYVFDNQEASKDFFERPELAERFINLWITLAKRFAKDKEMLVFELLNEIVNPNVYEQWNRLIEKTIDAIRAIDPEVRIMYGGVCFNSITSVKLLEPPKYENIIFTFHCYEPIIFTHRVHIGTKGMPWTIVYGIQEKVRTYIDETKAHLEQMMVQNLGNMIELDAECDKKFFFALFQEAVDIAERYQIPLYCGEYGVIDRADPQSALHWYKDIREAFKDYGIGSAAWSYKQMDFGIIDDHYDSVRGELVSLL